MITTDYKLAQSTKSRNVTLADNSKLTMFSVEVHTWKNGDNEQLGTQKGVILPVKM